MDIKNKLITRKDVAEAAGVSPTIVSYVINNNRYVDEEKRIRVLKAIKELKYKPNSIARSLKNNKTNHIAFIVDEIDNEHFGDIVRHMEHFAYDKGYFVSLCNARNNEEYISQLISRQFDGVVISDTYLKEEFISRISDMGIHTVVLGNRLFYNLAPEITIIEINLYRGAQKATHHLINKGRKYIMYVDNLGVKDEFAKDRNLRLKGYLHTLIEEGVGVREEYIVTGCNTHEEVYEKCKEKLDQYREIDGIVAHDDRFALIAMRSITDAGLSIPKDIALVGFNNSRSSRYLCPALTTIDIPRKEIARQSIEILNNKINGIQVANVQLDTMLIERETT